MTDRPRTFEQWMAINPRLVATECSPVHIEYLIRDAQREIERLHVVIRLAVAMREAQARYFRDRSKENLIASKQAEAAFDKAAKEPKP